jgi:hypothetical protein
MAIVFGLTTNTAGILRPTLVVRTCLTVLCIAILATHVSGAHLHLCFDGGDPPASVHLTADVNGQVADKNAGKPVQFATLLGKALLIAREHLRWICSIPLFRLRPPLRAPPS